MHIIENIYDTDGIRRVQLFRRADGSFGFEEQHFSSFDFEHCWIPCARQFTTFCDSLEIALREAYGRVEWLDEIAR